MCDQPNRIVIVTGLSDAYITEIHAERPQDVEIVVYSIHSLVGTVFERKHITPLTVVNWTTCPDCEALIPPDGCCWYCENEPIEEIHDG